MIAGFALTENVRKIGEVEMTKQEVLNGLRIERECVSRDCDRNCANCDIVQERDWLLLVYDNAIKLIENIKSNIPIGYTKNGIFYKSGG